MITLELSHDTFSRNTRLQLRQLLDAVRELTTPPDPPQAAHWVHHAGGQAQGQQGCAGEEDVARNLSG